MPNTIVKPRLKILTFSLLALVAITVLIQYELREYFRFVPSNYWPLKFVFQYGSATVLIVISGIGGLNQLLKHKTFFSSTPLTILFFGLILVWMIRQQSTNIEYEHIAFKNDLYIDSNTGMPLDGTYNSPSLWDGFGDDEHCSKRQYEKGVPAGKWMYSYKGDLIHSGIYLEEKALQEKFISLTKSNRVDINLGYEGDSPLLTINLINAISTDTNTIETISELAIKSLSDKFRITAIYINNETEKERIQLK
jgi:hypothetical protein